MVKLNSNTSATIYESGRSLLGARRMSKCSTCGALLCIVNDEDGSNCIKEWHTKVNLRQVAQPARAGEEEKLNW